jgi:hypothetical protein
VLENVRGVAPSAQPAFRNANNDPLIVGAPVLLSDRHAKVRREGTADDSRLDWQLPDPDTSAAERHDGSSNQLVAHP